MAVSKSAEARLREQIWDTLGEIPDPEIPTINLVDLGVIEDVALAEPAGGEGSSVDGPVYDVTVKMLPTFVGCPAIELMKNDIASRVAPLERVHGVEVQVIFDPPWTTDRVTSRGRRQLAEFGIAPPVPGAGAGCGGGAFQRILNTMGAKPVADSLSRNSADEKAGRWAPPAPGGALVTPCPYCGSTKTRMENPFGPTPCRAVFYCDSCRNPFEKMKEL